MLEYYYYTKSEITEIKQRLDSIVGKFCLTSDNDIFILQDYHIGEMEIKKGFFKKHKEIVYHIISLVLWWGDDKITIYTDENFCNDIAVDNLYRMKENADSLIENFKKFGINITTNKEWLKSHT